MDYSFSKKGFTIVEVMLVLAITAGLVAAIMSTVQISINRQRYLDTVSSFQDYLRSQYNQINNVAITKTSQQDLADIASCGINNGFGTQYGTGRSDCLVVGRYIRISGDEVKVKRIFYEETINNQGSNFDNFFNDNQNKDNQDAFDSAGIRESSREDKYFLEWSSEFKDIHDNDLQATILIIKSPVDGTVRTYARDGGIYNLTEMVGSNNDIDFCIKPANNPYGPTRAVRINKTAANGSGVEIMPADQDITRPDGSITKKVECQR